jgi:hypothetical protein
MRAGVTDLVVRPLSVMRGRVCVGASGSHSWLGASNYAQFSEQPGIQDICAWPLVSHARRGPETRPCVPLAPAALLLHYSDPILPSCFCFYLVCVFYYCRTYYKAVRVGGEESGGHVL